MQSFFTNSASPNQVVVRFVRKTRNTSPKDMSSKVCDELLVAYCALHHLLLYLRSRHSRAIIDFANRSVQNFASLCPHLGKFLVYLSLSSQYDWSDVASRYIQEVLIRNAQWMASYDSQRLMARLFESFRATNTLRHVTMFRVWLYTATRNESLLSYNDRLGRPQIQLRSTAPYKMKQMLSSVEWSDFFRKLNVFIRDDRAIDQLLHFAVFKRQDLGKGGRGRQSRRQMPSPPKMAVIGSEYEQETEQKRQPLRSDQNARGSQGVVRPEPTDTEALTSNEASQPSSSSSAWNLGDRGSLFDTADRTYSSNAQRTNGKGQKQNANRKSCGAQCFG